MVHAADDGWDGGGTRLHYQFYGDLGTALTQWANLERAIFWVFSHAFAHPERGRSAEIFYAVQFHQKVALTTQALESSGTAPDAMTEWRQLAERARRHSATRNKLAHWVVTGNAADDGRDRYRLHPPNEGYGYPGALTVADFQPIWTRFNELAQEIEDFWQRLVPQNAPPVL